MTGNVRFPKASLLNLLKYKILYAIHIVLKQLHSNHSNANIIKNETHSVSAVKQKLFMNQIVCKQENNKYK